MKMNTVNVIKFASGTDYQIDALESHPDTPDGNKDAEATFQAWVRKAKGDEEESDEEMDACLDDGICEVGEGAIVIVHSCPHPGLEPEDTDLVDEAIENLREFYPELGDRAYANAIARKVEVPDTGNRQADYENIRDQVERLVQTRI